jgi:hypothetical protein
MNPTCTKSTQTERETCSRCGGTGRMPFAVYGGICFKCGGQGFALTKRGAEAERYLRELRSVPAQNLKVGQLIRVDSLTMSGASLRYFATISSITVVTAETATVFSVQPDGSRLPCGVGHIRLETNSPKFGVHVNELAPDHLVRVGLTAEQKAETLAKALAYQDTLTKQGKPRKTA